MITDVDMKHLRRCVELAETALEKGDEPFGSVLVSAAGEVLFEDHNHVAGGDHTQHPEFNIARWAANNMAAAERSKNIARCALPPMVGSVSGETFMPARLSSCFNGWRSSVFHHPLFATCLLKK